MLGRFPDGTHRFLGENAKTLLRCIVGRQVPSRRSSEPKNQRCRCVVLSRPFPAAASPTTRLARGLHPRLQKEARRNAYDWLRQARPPTSWPPPIAATMVLDSTALLMGTRVVHQGRMQLTDALFWAWGLRWLQYRATGRAADGLVAPGMGEMVMLRF